MICHLSVCRKFVSGISKVRVLVANLEIKFRLGFYFIARVFWSCCYTCH